MGWDGEERRSSPRARCVLPIELRIDGSPYPAQAETTDVATTGCYVTTMFPLPVGTKLTGALSIGSRKMEVKCQVITMDPNLGNGIRFVEMSEDDRDQLKSYLDGVEPSDTDSGSIIR